MRGRDRLVCTAAPMAAIWSHEARFPWEGKPLGTPSRETVPGTIVPSSERSERSASTKCLEVHSVT